MHQPLIVIGPQLDWPRAFASEAARISQALGDLDHEVHHIGSTSINDIFAKPIIDMLLLVTSLEELDAKTHRLEASGYEAKGEYGIPQRRYFRLHSAQGARTHHLHAFTRGSEGDIRHRAFRDYMNKHPQAAKAYSDLKRELAAMHPGDHGAYMDGKDAFVKKHELLALAWCSTAHRA